MRCVYALEHGDCGADSSFVCIDSFCPPHCMEMHEGTCGEDGEELVSDDENEDMYMEFGAGSLMGLFG